MQMQKNTQVIHERSIAIPISKTSTTIMKEINIYDTDLDYDSHFFHDSQKTNDTQCCSQYSLKQNYFDPSKSSPPNEFMIKLYMRYMTMSGQA
jgi:hypothetical protein